MKTHKHLLITAFIVARPTDEEVGRRFLSELVEKIDMQVFMPPVCKYSDDPENEGLTGVIGLTTSHISFHIWNKTPAIPNTFMNMDVYSCRDFDPQVVIDHIETTFGLKGFDMRVIDRSPSWRHGHLQIVRALDQGDGDD